MSYQFTLIPGDGIGPEVTQAAVEVMAACDLSIEWDVQHAGATVVAAEGTPLPPRVLASIQRNRIALKGPVTTPVGEGFTSVNVALRKALNLYASLRPVRSLAGIATPWSQVDLVVVRENTEGLYCGLEHLVAPGVAVAIRLLSREATLRLARFAYEYARTERRKKVTVGHKADVVRLADGLFLDTVKEVSQDYPLIQTEVMTIDNLVMELALDPTRFDVILLDNLFGDIASDMAAGLVGGLGLVPGGNFGPGMAVFEAAHGSAPDIAGQGVANPIAVILSAALMLNHIGERRQGRRIEDAVRTVLEEGKVLTRDLGGSTSTAEMTQAIVEALKTER
ncbi:MAG: isocitrate/isopropylmalate dehydrogenase family protein [Bradymonadales bacterium]|nr:isocitrate/isopropylmalate dehydrogenase family protein [Bradymonadales bacterium]